jgi:hypothetical protein
MARPTFSANPAAYLIQQDVVSLAKLPPIIMSSAPGTRNPLLIPELFYGILDFLAESTSEPSRYDLAFRTPDPDGRRALAALAQTCRGFTEPSLDLLWRRLNSLKPLLRCFQPREIILGGMPNLVGELFLRDDILSDVNSVYHLQLTGLSSNATPTASSNSKSKMIFPASC